MLRRLAVLALALFTLSLATPRAFSATPPVIEDRATLVRAVYRLVNERLALMPSVAAAKWATGTPVHAPEREAQVIAAAGRRAEELGLDPRPVRDVFALQIRLANELQTRLIAEWQAGAPPPGDPAPSLGGALRPRIDLIGQQLLDALYLAAPYIGTQDPDTAVDVLDAERLSVTERAEIVAAVRQIRLTTPASLERAKRAGLLRIGLPADYAPFAFLTADGLAGSDVALTGQLAHAMGLTPVYIRTTWRGLIDDLTADRFDLAAGGISVTPARSAVAGFSHPIAQGGKTALGRCADRTRFSRDSDIDEPGVRVIENAGGTNEQFARRHLTRATLLVHPDNIGVFAELLAGRADVMYTDDVEIERLTRHEQRLCRLTGDVFEPAEKALLALPTNGFVEAANRWLASPEAQGVPQALLHDAIEH
jgi:cyclohexadienyl dehydratase